MSPKPGRLKKNDTATVIEDPRAVFNQPSDVLAERNLSREEKLLILYHWERDARSLAVAALGGETPKSSAETKHGG